MKKIFKTIWIFIPLVAAALMYFLLPLCPSVTEYVFSRGLFKIVTVPLGFITSLLPFSLTELLVVLAVPLFVFVVIVLVVKIKKSSSRKKTLLKALRAAVAVVSCAAFMYMVCHGANYYRYPIEQIMELDTSQKTADDLYNACVYLAKGAAEARAELGLADDEPFRFSESYFEELTRTNSGYKTIEEEYPFFYSSVIRQKPVMLSKWWSYTGIVGMYFPFFAESNVNIDQPDYAIPFTAAHESAHSRGIAFENECNFLAFLSCINSEYAEFRYSGYMEAFVYCSNALLKNDSELWAQSRQYCTAGMITDFSEHNAYIDAHKGKVEEVSTSVNNTFISSQGVSDGVLSYDRVTELILAYLQKNPPQQ